MRSDAATHPETDADSPPAAHDLLAGLVEDALAVSEDLRARSADPVLHAAVEALTAARDLLGLAADGDADGGGDPAAAPSPDRRDAVPRDTGPRDTMLRDTILREAVLREALDSIRAASSAVRFALVEEGDRRRARRGRPEGPAWR